MNCKYLLEGKCIGRPCVKDDTCSCKFWGFQCVLDEAKVEFDDSDGEPQ